MAKLVANTAKGRIRNTTAWPKTKMTAEQVVDAFGGRPLDITLGEDQSPPTLLMIRDVLMAKLQSSGGRPTLVDTDKKPKIPMSSEDWKVLEDMASAAMQGIAKRPVMSPSPSQIGAVLMHWAISQAKKDPSVREKILEQVAER